MTFEAGFGQADITPQVGISLSGFIFRENKPSTAVDDPLFVRVLAVRHQTQINLLASYELLGIGNELYHLIVAELQQTFGDQLPEENCVLTATHSHSGPPTVHLDGEADPNPIYWQTVVRQTVHAAREAIDHLTPSTLHISSLHFPGLTYNRRAILVDGRVTMALEPDAPLISRGPVDDQATLLVFRNRDGENIGGIIHFASHGVAVCTQSIGSDIPGQIASQLSEILGAPCLYLQGAAGDLNPTVVSTQRDEMYPWVNNWMVKARLMTGLLQPVNVDPTGFKTSILPLDYAPLPDRDSTLERITGLEHIAQGDVTSPHVQEAIQLLGSIMNVKPGETPEAAKAAYCAGTLAGAERRTLAAIELGRSLAPCPLNLSTWHFGELTLAFIAAEIFASTGLKLRALDKDRMILPVTYASPLVGYIPDEYSIDKGGYEVANGWQFYGHPAPFIRHAETNVIQAIRKIL